MSMQRIGSVFVIAFLAACTAGLRAQAVDGEAIGAALTRLLAAPVLDGARVGVVVFEPGSTRVLAEARPDEGFITASNMKLISSAVALEVLGRDHVFVTRLEGAGALQADGTFVGDLVLVGDGDPTLGAAIFEKAGPTAPFVRMAAELEKRGIQRITGRVIGDDSCQPDEVMGLGWDWSYHADWYAAQVGGLCFNENCIDVVFDGTAGGQLARLRFEPATRYVQIENRVRCVEAPGSESSAGTAPRGVTWSRRLGGNHIVLTGSLSSATRSLRDSGSVHNPTAFAATVLRETLVRHGIAVDAGSADLDEVETPPAQAPRVLLAEHRSPQLAVIVRALNKRSQNLYAEQLPRAAARARKKPASMAGAREVARTELARLGVDTRRLVLADGSGLSRLNMVAPRQLATLLHGMQGSPNFEVYLDSLPLAGVDGTLRRRFAGSSVARGRVRAKTGFVSRTVGLSGYVPRGKAAPLVFSILVNDFVGPAGPVQAAVDRFVEEVCAACPAS